MPALRVSVPVPGARIQAIGDYRPSTVLSNTQVADLGGLRGKLTDDWVRRRVGVVRRHVAGSNESVVDMAVAAGSKALAAAGADPSDVDLLVLATCSMPSPMPHGAASVAARLGARGSGAFDVNAACSGFCYALAIADAAIRSGDATDVLVVAAERMRDWVDPADPTTAVVFADGAGAALVVGSDRPGIGPVAWGSDGTRADLIRIPDRYGTIDMLGPAVFRWTITELVPVARRAIALAGVRPEELAAFVPHQANLRIIDALAEALGATGATVARDIVDSGNTSAASIPLALATLVARGEISSGEPVLLLGFGAGLAYAAQVVLCP
jgi:3-oxoacyl-[acyl-carrier-protein] synthase III